MLYVDPCFAGVACMIVATSHQQILLSSDIVAIITLLLLLQVTAVHGCEVLLLADSALERSSELPH